MKENHFWGCTFHFDGGTEVKNTNYYYHFLGIILYLQNKKIDELLKTYPNDFLII